MQVVSFYGLLDNYQIPGMSKNKSEIQVCQEYWFVLYCITWVSGVQLYY